MALQVGQIRFVRVDVEREFERLPSPLRQLQKAAKLMDLKAKRLAAEL